MAARGREGSHVWNLESSDEDTGHDPGSEPGPGADCLAGDPPGARSTLPTATAPSCGGARTGDSSLRTADGRASRRPCSHSASERNPSSSRSWVCAGGPQLLSQHDAAQRDTVEEHGHGGPRLDYNAWRRLITIAACSCCSTSAEAPRLKRVALDARSAWLIRLSASTSNAAKPSCQCKAMVQP